MNSSLSLKVLTASLLFASTFSLAFAAPVKDEPKDKSVPAATPCPTPAVLTDGFYVGFQGGYDSYKIRENLILPTSYATTGNTLVDGPGWVGGLFFGYGRYIKTHFYLGAEINVNDSGVNANFLQTSNAGYYKFNLIARGSYGISLLPGVKLTDNTLGYLRVGYSWVNLRTQESTADGATLNAINKSHTSQGLSYGLGLETLVYPNWALRAEYTHFNYSSFSSGMGTTFHPSDNQYMLGILYHFMF